MAGMGDQRPARKACLAAVSLDKGMNMAWKIAYQESPCLMDRSCLMSSIASSSISLASDGSCISTSFSQLYPCLPAGPLSKVARILCNVCINGSVDIQGLHGSTCALQWMGRLLCHPDANLLASTALDTTCCICTRQQAWQQPKKKMPGKMIYSPCQDIQGSFIPLRIHRSAGLADLPHTRDDSGFVLLGMLV